RAFIQRTYVNHFWLGHAKYQASRAFTFAPLSDYDEAVQLRIRATSVLDNFKVAVPNSEQRRLVADFETLKPELKRLDLVVLSNDESLARFAPPEDQFRLSYRNSTFRVWKQASGEGRQEPGGEGAGERQKNLERLTKPGPLR